MYTVYYHGNRSSVATISSHATRREALDECARLNEGNRGETGHYSTDADVFAWHGHRIGLDKLQRARLHGDEDGDCVTVRTYGGDDVQIPEADVKLMLAEI